MSSLTGRVDSRDRFVHHQLRLAALLTAALVCLLAVMHTSPASAAPTPANPDFTLRLPTPSGSISATDYVHRLNQLQFGTSVVPLAAGTTESFVTRDGANFWENYPPATGQIGPLPINTRLGWRYNYDSNYAVVLRYQTSQWGFILRGSITCCKNDGSPN